MLTPPPEDDIEVAATDSVTFDVPKQKASSPESSDGGLSSRSSSSGLYHRPQDTPVQPTRPTGAESSRPEEVFVPCAVPVLVPVEGDMEGLRLALRRLEEMVDEAQSLAESKSAQIGRKSNTLLRI